MRVFLEVAAWLNIQGGVLKMGGWSALCTKVCQQFVTTVSYGMSQALRSFVRARGGDIEICGLGCAVWGFKNYADL